jgi:hypothetical protein
MAGCKKTRDMMSMNETPKQDEKDGEKTRKKKHLLNDQSFEALTQLQKEIVRETGWMPSLNKLVNALVNTKTLLYLKKIMLKTVKDHQP